MAYYHTLGKIPLKRHTQFEKPNGGLYSEELFSTHGFSSVYSNIYHEHPPTMIKKVGSVVDITPEIAVETNIKHFSLRGFDVKPTADYLQSRKVIFINNDLEIALAAPQKSMTDYFYKNTQADEVIFIHKGSGVLKTMYGQIRFEYGDYIIIPRGTVYQFHFDNENNRLLITESFSRVTTPKRYRNAYGQMEEHAPFCERDFKVPQDLETNKELGDYRVITKKDNKLHEIIYAAHPFDVIGWDGYSYPYAFSIHDFEPITGRLHQPPPVHQTFEGHNFVICSFVPRLFDYHPKSIPAPYNHSNVDSDELLYYVDGDFMSRNHIEEGQITLHPSGIAHGPHPGAVERSIGQKSTDELAVMIDTFKPLKLTKNAMNVESKDYFLSWLPK